jgi:hypothetical protein
MSNFRVFPSLADLDRVFELRLETDPSANPTKLYYPGRNDLCLRYKMWAGSGTQAAKTRYNVIQSDGTFKDLNEIFAPAPPKGITWVAMGTGTSNTVSAISAYDNLNVYVGGLFTNIGGDTFKRYIAKWDGVTWQAMGTGTGEPSTFSSLAAISAVDNLNVYVGGDFRNIGGDTNKRAIVKWDGTTWHALLPSPPGGLVFAVDALDNSNVYVGGLFGLAGGISTRRIARWDGAAWRAMGTGDTNGFDDQVLAISAVDTSNVYAGGGFKTADGRGASFIARWDGATWRAMGDGTTNQVRAISALDNSNVYVGGQFTNIGGDNNKRFIAKWDGDTWQALSSGVSSTVLAIYAVDNSNVYIGGQFANIGGDNNKRYIARWDGATWRTLSTGISGVLNAISAVDNSNVYVGGAFTDSGGEPNADRIVKWTNDY